MDLAPGGLTNPDQVDDEADLLSRVLGDSVSVAMRKSPQAIPALISGSAARLESPPVPFQPLPDWRRTASIPLAALWLDNPEPRCARSILPTADVGQPDGAPP